MIPATESGIRYLCEDVSERNMRYFAALCLLLTLAACGADFRADPATLALLPERVDYNLHVKPLLSDRCYACHGPDENARQSDLRLHTQEGALFRPLQSGGRAIVPGRPGRSGIMKRISSHDADYRMPPAESNLTLSDYDIALIQRWIDQGADWKPHWAFTPPELPDIPTVQQADWAINNIDRFILARLEREGLTPSEEADRTRLIRRVSFDLTGLPPTLEEIDAFLADDRPDAYERVVDRLLQSPAYGERMATEWMDLSRYADSHGYHADGIRTMWPWRDWIIDAFNENLPYDQFVTWQLAGDLLPDATLTQKLATGFNRNHPMTAEGGVIDEEYRIEYVVDRANTTSRAFLGLTMECARCHDHKFDPISQAEYFQLSAFFNNVKELGMTGDDGNAGPLLMLPTDEEETRIEDLRNRIASLEGALANRAAAVAASGQYADAVLPEDALAIGLSAHYPLDELQGEHTPNLAPGGTDGGVVGELEIVEGPVDGAVRFDHDYDYLQLTEAGAFERTDPFSVSLWIHPDTLGTYTKILGNAFHKNTYWRGWELYLDSLNHVSARLIHALPHNYLHITTTRAVPAGSWTHVTLTYDGSSTAGGLKLFLDGAAAASAVRYNQLYKSILPVDGLYELTQRAVRVARSYRAFGGDDGIFTGNMDDLRMYARTLTRAEVAKLADTSLTVEPLEIYLNHYDETYRGLLRELHQVRRQEQEAMADVLETMVMEEMDSPRPTYVLDRGLYDQPLQPVQADIPGVLGSMADDLPRNRLGLADWLFSPDQPLTARVTVNRYWLMLFGQGLVVTPEDFGNQGALPSHPELLDYLATTFQSSGWDVKAFLKSLVMSATYRQSSIASPELYARDPANILLARGPRYRLSAEMIRDNALVASGLLVDRIGGPSVKPYQPPGLWIEKGNFSQFLLHYKQDEGESLYRRSLYTFIRRTSPPPSMLVFDAPDRTTCFVRRQNTNTPLQALVLLNDPQYVEASRVLAERMQHEGGASLEDQITHGFRLAAGRYPAASELELLTDLFETEQDRFIRRPADMDSLFAVGDYARDPTLEKSATAALAMVAQVLLNHDDTYTKR